jgi:autotransporter-associated beta strand protein
VSVLVAQTAFGAPGAIPAGPAEWNSSVTGSWDSIANWKDAASTSSIVPPGLSGATGDTVLFDSATGSTVNLDGASPSVAGITFDNSSTGFTIAQGLGGVLHFANGGTSAIITVVAGSHTISAPLQLDSNVTILPAAGSELTISGNVSGAAALVINDRGKVVLSGTNGYTGGTVVSSGTLLVTSASSIASGTDLTIGAGASQYFTSRVVKAAPVIASSAVAAAGAAVVTPAAASVIFQPASPPVLLTPKAADAVHAGFTFARPGRIAMGPMWPGQSDGGSSDSDDRHAKDAALLALEAVFAQYGN